MRPVRVDPARAPGPPAPAAQLHDGRPSTRAFVLGDAAGLRWMHPDIDTLRRFVFHRNQDLAAR